MTNEEAIFCEKSYIGETNCTDCKYYIADTCLSIESYKMAVKALEQGLVLDQIKAEIEQNAYPIVHGVNNHEKGMTLNGILQIINKYKAGE